jgi:chromosome partitioning protein
MIFAMEVSVRGEDMRGLREERSLSQADFAAWLNERLDRRYDRSKISRWESNSEKIPDALVRFLLKETAIAASKHGPALVVCSANQKGGVGKTTCTVNTASLLAKEGYRVLIIDADPQANATAHMGIDLVEYEEGRRKSLAHVLREEIAIEHIVVAVGDTGLEIAPSSIELASVEVELTADPSGPMALRERLQDARQVYDFIFIDCPPNLGQCTANGLVASDVIVIPCQTEYLSSIGVNHLLKTINKLKRRCHPSLAVLGILPTMYNPRLNQHQVTLEQMHTALGSALRIFPPVPRATIYGDAALAGRAALEAVPDAPGAASYRALADTLIAERSKRVEVANVA